LTFDHNIFLNLSAHPPYFWNGLRYTLTQFQAATGHETHSQSADPRFANPSTNDFTLQSTSPAVDAGTFLTTTVGSGSGTSLTVADAGYFMDGFGLVAGDMMQVGSNSPVQITAIDYGTNTITVARSISWSNGQGVSLPYSGTRPDIGADGLSRGGTGNALVAHWPLDEGTGTSAADATGHGHTGTLIDAPTWSLGRIGPSALTFDGRSQCVRVPGPFRQSTYTWALWIKGTTAPDTATNQQVVVNGSGAGDNWGFNWSNTFSTFQQAAYQKDDTGALVAAQIAATTPLSGNQWYHVVGTYDGADLKVYLNGLLSGRTNNVSLHDAEGDFGIGNHLGRSNGFAGQIADVRVYNYALSAAEVQTLYENLQPDMVNVPTPHPEPGFV